jgi:hypothetical protein
MPPVDAALDAKYRATTYRVFVRDGVPIDLHIGEASAALDALLAGHVAKTWAFITAWNPASRRWSAEENDSRQAELRNEVRARGWRSLEGAGVPARSDWQPEASLLVLDISKADAVALGRRFGQNAIVAGRLGEAAELIYCD